MTDSPLTPLAPGVTPIVMHIEHTGGTTLRQVIERQYAAPERYEIYTYAKRPATRFIQMSEAERRRFKLVIGHLFYGVHRHVPGQSRYLTIVRHPIDRIISSYTYLARQPNRVDHERYKANDVTWPEHFENRRDHIRQISRIIGGDDELIQSRRMKTLPDGALEIAIRHLEEDFAMVGLQERYDESLLMMRHVLNWHKPVVYVRQNTTTRRVKLADLPADDRALIEKMAEIEMPLYEYAKQRFAAQIAAYPGDIERDLAQFRRDNERYLSGVQSVERLKAPFRAIKRALRRASGRKP